MPAISPATRPGPGTRPCPHCGKPYRTLVKRDYGLQIVAGIQQSVPLHSQWRRLSCGKSYSTATE